MLWPLYSRARTTVPIYLEAGWETEMFWTCVVMIKLLAPIGSRTPVRPARSLLAKTSNYARF